VTFAYFTAYSAAAFAAAAAARASLAARSAIAAFAFAAFVFLSRASYHHHQAAFSSANATAFAVM
jgi:hypothetical protein